MKTRKDPPKIVPSIRTVAVTGPPGSLVSNGPALVFVVASHHHVHRVDAIRSRGFIVGEACNAPALLALFLGEADKYLVERILRDARLQDGARLFERV